MELRTLVEDFTSRLSALIEAQTVERARAAATAALGAGNGRRGRSTPVFALVATGKRPRRRGPKQLCPVPGCKNPAAPVFGMVCAQHKDVPKTKIKKYREARRAAKNKRAA